MADAAPVSDIESGGRLSGLSLKSRPRSLSAIVYDAILEAIVNKTFAPGETVTEAAIAERLNVSKTPVREAFLRLRMMGLIEVHGQRGLRVVQFSPEKLFEAYEVRQVLEPYMAGVAARASDEMRSAIVAAANESLQAARQGDLHGFRSSDSAFHEAIADAVPNRRIRGPNDAARALIATLRQRDFPQIRGLVTCAEQHVAIAAAITGGNAQVAAAEMDKHIRDTQALITADLPAAE